MSAYRFVGTSGEVTAQYEAYIDKLEGQVRTLTVELKAANEQIDSLTPPPAPTDWGAYVEQYSAPFRLPDGYRFATKDEVERMAAWHDACGRADDAANVRAHPLRQPVPVDFDVDAVDWSIPAPTA